MELVDTHCHIHFSDYGLNRSAVLATARKMGVTRVICVGTTLEDSQLAIDFAAHHSGVWASIGLHPHEASNYVDNAKALDSFSRLAGRPKVVAVGETGLDYFYNHSPRDIQLRVLRLQIELAAKHDLPLIFHVRGAFKDFWSVFDQYQGLRGVVHSFTASTKELDQILERGLYVALNGIMTFTKKTAQLEAARAVPLNKLLVETDAPFLTPTPYRGTICEPKHVRVTAEFISELRDISLEKLASSSTENAVKLFGLA